MIRQASAADIEEVVAIDDDACALFDQVGLHFDLGPEHPFARSEQISVRTDAMRRGIGRRLLTRVIEWAAGQPLWLTTYAHVPWNRPFYESVGFAVVPERECPPEILRILEEQRRWLPDPGERIAMRRPAEPPESTAGYTGGVTAASAPGSMRPTA